MLSLSKAQILELIYYGYAVLAGVSAILMLIAVDWGAYFGSKRLASRQLAVGSRAGLFGFVKPNYKFVVNLFRWVFTVMFLLLFVVLVYMKD